jgi:hypothetical protein
VATWSIFSPGNEHLQVLGLVGRNLLCRGRRVYRGTCRLDILIFTQEESQNDFNMVAKAYALLYISRHSGPKALK